MSASESTTEAELKRSRAPLDPREWTDLAEVSRLRHMMRTDRHTCPDESVHR
ncbi:MAG: hypothetical protein IPL79_03085 [Myxococcales bacterium]|nr:hypothetical protein [Myxococcales bacterium]